MRRDSRAGWGKGEEKERLAIMRLPLGRVGIGLGPVQGSLVWANFELDFRLGPGKFGSNLDLNIEFICFSGRALYIIDLA